MDDRDVTTTIPPALALAFEIRDEIILHDGLPVGSYDDGTLTVNLGWCRLAGLSVRVEDDPQVDRHRDGVALERDVALRAR